MKGMTIALRIIKVLFGACALARFLYILGIVGNAELGTITLADLKTPVLTGFGMMIGGAVGCCLIEE